MVELYIWQSCPFCQKVLRAAAEIGLQENKDYTIIEAGPGTSGRLKVNELGGKTMVPFLIDGTTNMYESDDIIAYLKQKALR
jgi:glutaredoxin